MDVTVYEAAPATNATPQIIENPYFSSENASAESGSTSQLIINPFYEAGDGKLADGN